MDLAAGRRRGRNAGGVDARDARPGPAADEYRLACAGFSAVGMSADLAVSEAELANLKMVPSRVVKPPRVERSPIALECIYNKTVDLVQANGKKSINSLVIGEVVNIHIDDAVITDGNIDMARIRPIARLGYMDYTSVDNIFTMHRVPVR